MSDFTMDAEIRVKATQAIKEINRFEKTLKDSKKEFSILGRTMALDSQRMGKSLAMVGGAVGLAFGFILSKSPDVRNSFKMMEVAAFEIGVELGGVLAPMLNDTVVPAMEGLRDIILELPTPIQQWIVLTISLTLFITALTVAVIALSAASIPLIAAIVGISIFIASLIMIYQMLNDVINVSIDVFLLIATIISIVVLAALIGVTAAGWALIVVFIAIGVAIFLIIKYWMTWTGWLITAGQWMAKASGWGLVVENAFEGIAKKMEKAGLAGKIFAEIFRGIGVVVAAVVTIIGGFVALIGNLVELVGQALSGSLAGVLGGLEKIIGTIGNVIATLLNVVIRAINVVLEGIDKGLQLVGESLDYRIPLAGMSGSATSEKAEVGDLGDISQGSGDVDIKQEGGTVDKTGLIFAHREEEVLRPVEARAWRKQRDRGGGGGQTINNTFNIGSVRNRSDIMTIAKEVGRIQKQQSNQRYNA